MSRLQVLALLITAIGLASVGLTLLLVQWRMRRRVHAQHLHLERILLRNQLVILPRKTRGDFSVKKWAAAWYARWSSWLDSPLGEQFVAKEDRYLMAQCGVQSKQGSMILLLTRIGLVTVLPVAAWIWGTSLLSKHPLVFTMALVTIGYFSPKWWLRYMAARRRRQVQEELPLLVDLLALLQGSGQGVDQSLQIIASDFSSVLPVLSQELGLANRLYSSGRTRDQAFSRMSALFHSRNLADLTALLIQIDKYGGAVQEPLRQFGVRLREERRMQMKEIIGKVTVKMTAIMVLTLLPALMAVTAGPGFLAISRALGG